MKKLTFIFIIVLVLLVSACERFTKPEPETGPGIAEEIETYFQNDIKDALDSMTSGDVSSIMAFYSDSYLNQGLTKTDIENEFTALMQTVTAPFTVSIDVISEDNLTVEWSFASVKEIPETDVLIENGDGYLFYGNQMEPPSEDKTVAFVEILTATWCPNCPELEHEIEALKATYGSSLSYVEYHYNDGLSGDFSELQSWYNIYSAPTGVLQGSNIFVGSEEITLSQYDGIINTTVNTDATITFENFNYTLEAGKYTVQLELDNPGSVAFDNLYLRYMFIEETSATNNYAGDPCKNVMLEQNRIALTDADFNGTYEFEHTVGSAMPDDAKLIILIQTMPETFDETTCKIHNVMEAELN